MTECNKSVYLANKSIDMIDAVNKGYEEGYNKAIDDFLKNLYKIGEHRDFDWEDMYKLAEQLKAGKSE